MTSRAPAWFEQKYIKGATHKLQSEGWLTKDVVNSTGEIKGNTAIFKVAGTGSATQMSDAIEDRPAMNADRTTVTATMVDYEANDWIKTTDIEKMSENEQQISQQTAAYAMGRKFDALTVAALDACATSLTVGDGTAAVSIVDIITAQNKIAKVAGRTLDYVCLLPFDQLSQLELFKEFANSQWVGDEFPLLKQAGARRWRGITFVPLPDVNFNIPASNKVDYFVYQKMTLGFLPNYAMVSRIDYVPEKKAYFAGNTMGCAHKVVLPEAVVKITMATNIAIARPST